VKSKKQIKKYSSRRRKKTFSEIFYETDRAREIWTDYGESMKQTLVGKLKLMKYLLTSSDLTDEYRDAEWKSNRRHIWGYNIFNNDKSTDSRLMTEACAQYIIQGSKVSDEMITYDHFYGTTEASERLRCEFEESNYDIDYMVNEWLPKNYHLFLKWRVTKEEHKKDNIVRAKHTIEEKDELKHLIKVSSIVPYKTMTEMKKEFV
jgi:hypothetical protein